MELKYVELDNTDNTNNTNNEKYWESQVKVQPIKKKVSFDDILLNMNLVVNNAGVLQFISPLQNNDLINQESEVYSTNGKFQSIRRMNNSSFSQKTKEESVEPVVKHSYIYNKYFKDYKNPGESIPEIRVPRSMEEYKRMLLEDKIKNIKEKNRISQIKSKKLIFTNTGNIKASTPVRMMRFN